MTIFVDRRIGSGDMTARFSPGVAVTTTLPFGDCAFIGQGPDGAPLRIGVEIKTISDACASIRSGRFAGHQLPGLLRDYDRIYVVLEGVYRAGPEGTLQLHRGSGWSTAEWGGCAWMYSELDGWINTVSEMAGVRVKRTSARPETTAVIYGLYHWWTSKDYEQHRSHIGFDESSRPALLVKPSLVRRIASQLPGIGWQRSGKVAARYKSAYNMVNSDEKSWREIDGVGKVIAGRVYNELRREE